MVSALTNIMKTTRLVSTTALLFVAWVNSCHSWTPSPESARTVNQGISRRDWFQNSLALASVLAMPQPAIAAGDVTDKVFLDIKGLPSAEGTTKRIVIGLFGKEAPLSVGKFKQLLSTTGLPATCKPKEERALQREQLEASKVYNSCIEGQDKGVTYDYAQIWRVIQGERIDFGSVAGRFVAREYPNWEESSGSTQSMKNNRPGVVSVRRGNESGFGFTVYPGGGKDVSDLDDNHIVIGQVLEGMDVIEEVNNIPVITSAKVNYMGLTGGPNTKSSPNRSCRYGGPMYCNEFKPLTKLTISRTGVLN